MIALSLTLALGMFAGIAVIPINANAIVCASYNSNCDGTNVQCLPSARDIGKC